MSFNRLMYDNCSYKANLGSQVSQLSYVMDPVKFENCNKCRHELGLVGGTNVSHIRGNLVDLESDLFSITRPITHCPDLLYRPRDDDKVHSQIGPYKTGCNPTLDTNKLHLRPCQMINYSAVPREPAMKQFSCDTFLNKSSRST